MSKDVPKVEINYENTPILADLDFADRVKKYHEIYVKEKSAEAEMKAFKTKRDPIGEELIAIVDAAGADTVNMAVGKKNFRTTLIKGDDDATKTDEDKLREVLMKIAKLDAATISRVFKAAQVPAPRKPQIRLTVQE